MKKANNKTNIVVNVPVFVKVLKMTKKTLNFLLTESLNLGIVLLVFENKP